MIQFNEIIILHEIISTLLNLIQKTNNHYLLKFKIYHCIELNCIKWKVSRNNGMGGKRIEGYRNQT